MSPLLAKFASVLCPAHRRSQEPKQQPSRFSSHSPRESFTKEDIKLPIRTVQTIHCDVDPVKGVTGLPREWKSVWKSAMGNGSETGNVPRIFRKLRKFPRNEMRRELLIVRNLVKGVSDADYELEAINALSDTEELESKYDILSELGSGSFGTVFKGRERENGNAVAIKRCAPRFVARAPSIYLNELIALKICKHKNVVSLINCHMSTDGEWESGVNGDDSAAPVRVPCFVMEIMDKSLFHCLTVIHGGRYQCLPETMATFVMKEILTGLAFLHQNGIFHRDIKSDNVLVSRNGEVKIADFGWSCRFTHREEEFDTRAGTCLWMPPEIILTKPYTFRADIWSLGILFVELFDGVPPYYDVLEVYDDKSIVNNLIVKHPPAGPKRSISPEFEDVFNATLHYRPEKRHSCNTILRFPVLEKASTSDEFAEYIQTVLLEHEE